MTTYSFCLSVLKPLFLCRNITASGLNNPSGHWYTEWCLGGRLLCPLCISEAITLAAVFDQYLQLSRILILPITWCWLIIIQVQEGKIAKNDDNNALSADYLDHNLHWDLPPHCAWKCNFKLKCKITNQVDKITAIIYTRFEGGTALHKVVFVLPLTIIKI